LLPTHADVEAAEPFDIIFNNDKVLSTGRRWEGKVLKKFSHGGWYFLEFIVGQKDQIYFILFY
jgi:hypothetical protein